MKQLWILLGAITVITATVIAVSACGTARESGSGGDSLSVEIDHVGERFLRQRSIPGMAIYVARDGLLIHQRHYGLADMETQEPVGPETLFGLGSLKKHMTAVAVVRLAAAGKLSLEDSLAQWLPQFSSQPALRLRHMLNQNSGLPDGAVEMFEAGETVELDFAPGTDWAYSNANFDLLDLVVKAADGRTFADYLQEELASPLGFETLEMCKGAGPPAGKLSRGYTWRDGARAASEKPCWLRGTARDLTLWVDALMSGQVVPEASLDTMKAPARLADGREVLYGFGLDLRPYRGLQKVWHTGHDSGWVSALAYYPDHGLTIAVAANSDALYDPESVEMAVARVILGLPEPEVLELPMTEQDLAGFSGVYDARSVWFRIEPGDDDDRRLFLTMQGPAEDSWEYVRLQLLRIGDHEFIARDSPQAVRVRFQCGPTPEATSAWIDMVGIRWHGMRR